VFLVQCFFDHGKFHPVISLKARPCAPWVSNQLRVRAQRAAPRLPMISNAEISRLWNSAPSAVLHGRRRWQLFMLFEFKKLALIGAMLS